MGAPMPKANEPRIVETFRAGDPVPEWMLSRTPNRPDATPGTLAFGVDVCVLELAPHVLMILRANPEDYTSGKPILAGEGITGHNFGAAGSTLIFPTHWTVFNGPDAKAAGGSDA